MVVTTTTQRLTAWPHENLALIDIPLIVLTSGIGLLLTVIVFYIHKSTQQAVPIVNPWIDLVSSSEDSCSCSESGDISDQYSDFDSD